MEGSDPAGPEFTHHIPGVTHEQTIALIAEAEAGYDLQLFEPSPNPHFRAQALEPTDLLDDLYVTQDYLRDRYQRAQDAISRAPHGSYISHHTAAALHALWPPPSPTIHLSVPPRARRALPGGITVHRGHYDACSPGSAAEIPVSFRPCAGPMLRGRPKLDLSTWS